MRIGSRAQKMPWPRVLFKQVPFFARRVCITLAIFFHLCMFPTRKPSDSTCSSNSLALVCLGAKCLQVSHPHDRSSCCSFNWPPVEQHAHIRTSALSAVGARADVYVGFNTDLDPDVDGDGDAFVDVHLHNVFHARADVDVDGEVDVEDSAHLYRCQCRCV